MLISPEDLRDRLDDPQLRLADVRWFLGEPERGRREYATGHLPGAVFVDVDSDLVAPRGPGRHPLPDPAAFLARLGELGFGVDHAVVAYDQGGGTIAARLWWMLDALGHPDVSLLDGGLPAWAAIGGPLTTEVPAWPPARLPLATAWPRTIDQSALAEDLGSVRLLDVRAPERYRGDTEPIDPVAGHIPTARSLPTGGNLGADGRFLAPEQLAERFAGMVDADRPTVVQCGSGINACHTAFAMRLAGLRDPLLYPGSYSDWSRSGREVATGPEPGARRDAVARPDDGPHAAMTGEPARGSPAFEAFIARFEPAMADLARRTRALVVELDPDVVEVVWPRQGTVGWGVGHRKNTEHYAWLAVFARHVGLGFFAGTRLPDPDGLLEGTGASLRHVKLRSAADLARPAVRDLLLAARRERLDALGRG